MQVLLARLTIALLHAQLPPTPAVDGYRVILLPSQRVISVEEAASRLDQLPKPVDCKGEVVDSILAIKCTVLSTDLISDWQFFLERKGDLLVEVDSPSFRTTVRISDLVEWEKQYLFTGPHRAYSETRVSESTGEEQMVYVLGKLPPSFWSDSVRDSEP